MLGRQFLYKRQLLVVLRIVLRCETGFQKIAGKHIIVVMRLRWAEPSTQRSKSGNRERSRSGTRNAALSNPEKTYTHTAVHRLVPCGQELNVILAMELQGCRCLLSLAQRNGWEGSWELGSKEFNTRQLSHYTPLPSWICSGICSLQGWKRFSRLPSVRARSPGNSWCDGGLRQLQHPHHYPGKHLQALYLIY